MVFWSILENSCIDWNKTGSNGRGNYWTKIGSFDYLLVKNDVKTKLDEINYNLDLTKENKVNDCLASLDL